MTDIGPDLRALIVKARKDPVRWGKPHGLSQSELAQKAGISAVWLRQIETGYTPTAKADTLGTIMYILEIRPDLLRTIGYPDVADSVEAEYMIHEDAIPDHIINNPDRRYRQAEQHLKATPGITREEREFLVQALGALRREEPLGADMWRRRGRSGKNKK
jgi:transcriptional regulator with XRE-family HTH domain